MAQYIYQILSFLFIFCLFKGHISNMRLYAGAQRVHSAYYTHRDAQQHTNMPNIKNSM